MSQEDLNNQQVFSLAPKRSILSESIAGSLLTTAGFTVGNADIARFISNHQHPETLNISNIVIEYFHHYLNMLMAHPIGDLGVANETTPLMIFGTLGIPGLLYHLMAVKMFYSAQHQQFLEKTVFMTNDNSYYLSI